jgi:formate transporter
MACKAEVIGVAKAKLDFLSTFMLAVLAGAFIALGACFYTTALTGIPKSLVGPARMLGGLPFSLGLILVVVGGAELFTGNTLLVIATVSGKIRFSGLLRNWAIVYIGNFVGSVAIAVLVYIAEQWKMGHSAVGVSAYNIAGAKLSLSFGAAFCSGILCNALVCLAVWLCYSARSTTDKILAIVFPITAFVALGFEHSVANMYLIPYGMFLSRTTGFINDPTIGASISKFSPSIFTTGNFLLHNLLPVTLGNIVGGSVFVGITYWVVYLRDGKASVREPAKEVEETLELRR